METFPTLLALCERNSLVTGHSWVNNREAGDLRRHRAHCDVIVMNCDPIESLFSISKECVFWQVQDFELMILKWAFDFLLIQGMFSIYLPIKYVSKLLVNEKIETLNDFLNGILTHWGLMASSNLANISSGNGLLSGSTKPLPESILTYHQWGLVAFTPGQFYRKFSRYQSLIFVWK